MEKGIQSYGFEVCAITIAGPVTEAFDGVGGFCPPEGFRIPVVPFDEGADIRFGLSCWGVDAPLQPFPRRFGEPTPDLIGPGGRGRRETDMPMRSPSSTCNPGQDVSRLPLLPLAEMLGVTAFCAAAAANATGNVGRETAATAVLRRCSLRACGPGRHGGPARRLCGTPRPLPPRRLGSPAAAPVGAITAAAGREVVTDGCASGMGRRLQSPNRPCQPCASAHFLAICRGRRTITGRAARYAACLAAVSESVRSDSRG